MLNWIKKLFIRPRIWVISDTHFFHRNIIKYDELPFRDENEMTTRLIELWNKCVKPKDIIIHLGDFGFGNKEKLRDIAGRLNGYKILILGNHDRHSKSFFRSIFNEVYNGYYQLKYQNRTIYFLHNPNKITQCGLSKEKDYIVYGHIHKNYLTDWPLENTFCACISHIGFAPVRLDKIIGVWDEKEKAKKSCGEF